MDSFSGVKRGDWAADMAIIHSRFKVNETIQALDSETLREYLQFRVDFLEEELTELRDAIAEGSADDVVDSLTDLVVVAIGTLDAFSVDSHKAWYRVYDKNLEKEPGENPNRPNKFGFPDMIKPENWQPPTHADNIGLLSKIFNQE